MFGENVPRTTFPDVQGTFEALGLATDSGRVTLRDDAPLAELRTRIMAGPGENPPGRGSDNAP